MIYQKHKLNKEYYYCLYCKEDIIRIIKQIIFNNQTIYK